MIYVNLLLVALVVVFIVDLSTFTASWKNALGRWLHIQVGSVKPFDCSLCMTWWVCLIYALCVGEFSIILLAYIALLAFMAYPMSQLLLVVRELVFKLINIISEKL